MRIAVAIGALVALASPVCQAQAQEADTTVRIRPGLGAQINPQYPGADDYEVSPYIKFSVASGDEPFGFGAPDDVFGIALLSAGGFRAGPAAALQGSRKDSDVGVPLGEVDRTIEVGAFAEFTLSEQIRLRGDIRKGVNGHEGLVASLGADQIWRDGDRYAISLGPRLLFADDRFQGAYFGVTPEAALASGLPAYRPDGGLYAVAAAAGLQYSLGGQLGLFGFARYERLVGDARESPVVTELGSPNQLSAGLGLSYTFTISR